MPARDDADRIDELESLLITAEILADGLKMTDLNGTLMCIRDSLREIRAVRSSVSPSPNKNFSPKDD